MTARSPASGCPRWPPARRPTWPASNRETSSPPWRGWCWPPTARWPTTAISCAPTAPRPPCRSRCCATWKTSISAGSSMGGRWRLPGSSARTWPARWKTPVKATPNTRRSPTTTAPSWWKSRPPGRTWMEDGETLGASIWAAPDLDGFINTWGTPGMKFDVSDDLAKLGGYIQVLDFYRNNTYVTECELDGRYDYDDGFYRGKYDYFVKCGGSGGPDYLILSAVPVDTSQQLLIVVQVQILNSSDVDAADRILATFDVVGTLP